MKNSISIILVMCLFTSCEKVIDLKYKTNQSNIVIEGNISNQPGPYLVKVIKSIPLKDTGSYITIDDAIVTISDDAGNSETLTPLQKGIYSTNTLAGIEGRTYTLTVQAENETYIAQSTMPQSINFDSIKVEEVRFTGDTTYNLIPVYADPLIKGNNYRFVLSVNNNIINQQLVQNDKVKNGIINNDRLEINDDDLTIKQGDLITLEMQCIDAKVSLFYTSLALMNDSGPGGGTTPNNPPNNFSNGALGIFSAYTIQTKSVTID